MSAVDPRIIAMREAIIARDALTMPHGPAWEGDKSEESDQSPHSAQTEDDLPLFAGRIDWQAFWQRSRTAEDWLIEPLLPKGRSVALYAPAKAGKSLLALEVGAAAATGRPVLDQPAGRPLTVLYLDYEMTEDDLYERLIDLGYGPDDEAALANLHYFLAPQLAPLDTVNGGTAVVREALRIGADLVVIDTVARVISGEEQASDTFFHLNRYLMSPLKNAGITVLRIDHAGKKIEAGQRNSSAKNDDVDVVWQLTAGDSGSLTLRATHRRLPWVPETVQLTRTENPLVHRPSESGWPAGTNDVADLLDTLDVPHDATVRHAMKALREAGEGRKQEVVRAAVKYRRSGLPRHGTQAGTQGFSVSPDTTPDTTPDEVF